MYHLYSYQKSNGTDYTSTYGITLFVGNASTRSAYSSIEKFYHEPYTTLDYPFADSDRFDSQYYSRVCELPNLKIATIRAAITNHFPETFI